MQENQQPRGRLRFGVFELDLRTGELRKHSLLVRLQEQPFQVLAMLLEQAGARNTRRTSEQALAGKHFRGFRPRLNKAISKILTPSATQPKAPALWRPLLGAATAF